MAFDHVVKIGRWHLMDAVPVRLGQDCCGYEQILTNSVRGVRAAVPSVAELALGGSAVGSGLFSGPDFAPKNIANRAISIQRFRLRVSTRGSADGFMVLPCGMSGSVR